MAWFRRDEFRERKHEGQETMGLQPLALALRRESLLDFRKVHDGGFGVLSRDVGMTGLAVSDGFLQFFDALIQVRIFYARRLRML